MAGQPAGLALKMSRYLIGKKIRRRRRFPLTMMLEPLEKCNLACQGCGRIREYGPLGDKMMTVEECLEAVAECGAPVVSVTGGEPLMHPDIDRIVDGILQQGRFVYLCTNSLLMKAALKKLKPSPHFTFVVHVDGLRETHDRAVQRRRVFDVAMRAIRMAREAGFRVCTNTTVYDGASPQEFQELFAMLTKTGVEGIMLSPGFQYPEAAEQGIFLARRKATDFFKAVFERSRNGTRYYHNPLYLDFLQGKRDYQCSQWTMPTRTPMGWRQPCYLIADAHVATFAELMETTHWDRYGFGRDPRCATCLMHCGYEGSALLEAMEKPSAMGTMLRRFAMAPPLALGAMVRRAVLAPLRGRT